MGLIREKKCNLEHSNKYGHENDDVYTSTPFILPYQSGEENYVSMGYWKSEDIYSISP